MAERFLQNTISFVYEIYWFRLIITHHTSHTHTHNAYSGKDRDKKTLYALCSISSQELLRGQKMFKPSKWLLESSSVSVQASVFV